MRSHISGFPLILTGDGIEHVHQAFREVAGQPVWDDWVAANKDQFDAQAVLDLVLSLAKGEES